MADEPTDNPGGETLPAETAKKAPARKAPTKTGAKTAKPASRAKSKPATVKAATVKRTASSRGAASPRKRTSTPRRTDGAPAAKLPVAKAMGSKTGNGKSHDIHSADGMAAKARELAADIKDRASDAIGNLGRVIGDSAPMIDQNVGPRYGDMARSASHTVADAADKLRESDVEKIAEDAKAFAKKSPGVTIGVAAVASLVFARIFGSLLRRK